MITYYRGSCDRRVYAILNVEDFGSAIVDLEFPERVRFIAQENYCSLIPFVRLKEPTATSKVAAVLP